MKYKIISVICIIALSAAVSAQTGKAKPEDQIKFRQSGMMFMRWNMAKIKNQVVKNPQAYNKSQVVASAEVIAAIANSGLDALFSPESATGEGWKQTRVKAEYFDRPEQVRERTRDFIDAADRLVSVSKSGDIDMIRGQFNEVFESCKSCHKSFRAKN